MKQTISTMVMVAVLGVLAGCSEPEASLSPPRTVTQEQRPTEFGRTQRERFPVQDLPGTGANKAPATATAGATAGAMGGFTATVPADWQALPATGMRQLNYRPGGVPDAECYLTASVGGGRLANVNRWVAQQFGQTPLTEAQFAALPRATLLGREAVVVSAAGTFAGMGAQPREGWSLIGVVAGSDDDMATVKFTGPTAVVAARRAEFMTFVASIRQGAGDAALPPPAAAGPMPPDHPVLDGGDAPHGTPAGTAAPFAATIPAGWVKKGDTGSRMLWHTFGTGGECYVGQLGGDPAAMVGIWCQDMGSPVPDAAGIAALPKVPMLGATAQLLDLRGTYRSMSGVTIPEARLLIAVAAHDGGVVFAKCLGPAAEVEAQREAFLAFCASLQEAGK